VRRGLVTLALMGSALFGTFYGMRAIDDKFGDGTGRDVQPPYVVMAQGEKARIDGEVAVSRHLYAPFDIAAGVTALLAVGVVLGARDKKYNSK
jgi:hypothetical protein